MRVCLTRLAISRDTSACTLACTAAIFAGAPTSMSAGAVAPKDMLHATAIASTPKRVDSATIARDAHANALLPAQAFGTAAVIYSAPAFSLASGFKLLERRNLRNLRVARTGHTPLPDTAKVAHA